MTPDSFVRWCLAVFVGGLLLLGVFGAFAAIVGVAVSGFVHWLEHRKERRR